MGGINWDQTQFGRSMGGQLRVIYMFTSVTLVIATAMTLMSIPERPLPKSQPNKNSGKNHLKSPSLPLPPSPPLAPGSALGLDEEEEDYSYSFSAKSCNSDPLAHSCSANARLCAGLTSPISPLSPLTPKYGSFISRDSSLTGINEFASSLGTSYIDSVLINCYTGQQTPQALASNPITVPLHGGDSSPLDKSTQGEGSDVVPHPAGESQDAEAPQPEGDAQVHGASQVTAGAHPGAGSHRGSSAGILKRPQSLALMEEPMATQIIGLENGRRRTVTFSQQVGHILKMIKAVLSLATFAFFKYIVFFFFFPLIKVANILLNGVRYESDLSENVETVESQMSMKLLCIAIYRMPPSLRSLCTNHFLGKNIHCSNFSCT